MAKAPRVPRPGADAIAASTTAAPDCRAADCRSEDETPTYVAVAMSGGLDSSMAAALLREAGHRVVGLTMRLWGEGPTAEKEAVAAARAVCQSLGIEHQVVDLREAFAREVIAYFLREYASGRTPNPCVRCNRRLKFGALLDVAHSLGCEALATGHYVRRDAAGGVWRLLTGLDARKDQSYFLYGLTQHELPALRFPLGDLRKDEVRALARARGLAAAERPESQDVCFVPAGDYRRYLAERLPEAMRPGPILDVSGRRLGEHRGLACYTVGQRSGLGIAAARPLYVLRLDPERNALIVGHAEALGSRVLEAGEVSFVAGRPPAPDRPLEARIRYRARRRPARIAPLPGERLRITLEEPVRDVAPGQAIVLYDGDAVVGGGIMERAVE